MSTFAITIKRIRAIEPHPNADAIEFAVIDGYRSIIRKGEFRQGDLVAYLPEASLLPQWLLKKLNFWDAEKECGTLTGKEGNRVKAIKLRGALSQGLCYPVIQDSTGSGQLITGAEPGCFADVQEGMDVTDILGVTKYEPPIPVAMAGEVFNAGQELTLKFDVENWKSYPETLQDGEEVVFTEKLHGTCTVVAILPYANAHPEAFGEKRNILVFSKGLGSAGLVFKDNERNQENLYVRTTRALRVRIDELQREDATGVAEPLFLLGETYGPNVQDLSYGKEVGFRVFAAVRGYRGQQRYQNWGLIEEDLKRQFGFETVPVLYRGPFSVAEMQVHTDGVTVMQGGHIREGLVIVPLVERWDPVLGRVCLKSVSAAYLTRKQGTEYS